jgi:hypothetical protein
MDREMNSFYKKFKMAAVLKQHDEAKIYFEKYKELEDHQKAVELGAI